MRDGVPHLCHTEPFSGIAASIERSIATASKAQSQQRLAAARRLARPAGLEPATPGLEGRGYEATGGSVEPLPPFSLRFSHTRGHPTQPRAATDCQSIVSRLAPVQACLRLGV